LFYNTH